MSVSDVIAGALVMTVCVFSFAGTEPRPQLSAYPVQAKTQWLAIGAEYFVHSLPGDGLTYFIPDYLVVEVGVFPIAGGGVTVSAGSFSLRVNGKKSLLLPQTPGMVAASLKYPDWARKPRLEAGAGLGDAGVILGRPQAEERFPGDPRPRQRRLPDPPGAPPAANPSGVEKAEPVPVHELVVETALPEGPLHKAVAGHLYFAHKGKTKRIRSLELLYEGPGGPVSLRLLQARTGDRTGSSLR